MSENIELKDYEERKKELFRNQKQLMDTFLEHGRRTDDPLCGESRRF